MTILVIDDHAESLKELSDNLQVVFPQEPIAAFGSALFALQYAHSHAKEIGLVFSAITMRQMDGITLANGVKTQSPGAKIFFLVETENSELAEIAKQHGKGTCLTRPITAERIRQATSFLHEPCPWEDDNCEERCMWEWCKRKQHKAFVREEELLNRREK